MAALNSELYNTLQQAYDHFNRKLFKGKLPPCVITLGGEMRRAYGYYRDQSFKDEDGNIVDQIALNPFTFSNRTDREIYSTLVHEMVHLWQHRLTEKKTKSHHDSAWADKMEEIGLMPTSTGRPGGKRTGRRVTHYIIEGGLYDKNPFGKPIKWRSHEPTTAGKKGRRRTKYTCPECDLNAYGKPDIHIKCGECDEAMMPC